MIRDTVAPRPDWQAKVEARGLIWHTNKDDGGDKPYWDEGTFYRFDRIEVDLIEGATAELYRLFLDAGQVRIFGCRADGRDCEPNKCANCKEKTEASYHQVLPLG